MLRAKRGEHRNWCPGYRRPAADLTVDHVVPLAAGGAPDNVPYTATAIPVVQQLADSGLKAAPM